MAQREDDPFDGDFTNEQHERADTIILGRRIGTHRSWDQPDDWILLFEDFAPIEGVKLPAGDISFIFEHGVYEVYELDGTVKESGDFVKLIADLPLIPREDNQHWPKGDGGNDYA